METENVPIIKRFVKKIYKDRIFILQNLKKERASISYNKE